MVDLRASIMAGQRAMVMTALRASIILVHQPDTMLHPPITVRDPPTTPRDLGITALHQATSGKEARGSLVRQLRSGCLLQYTARDKSRTWKRDGSSRRRRY